MKVVDVDTFVVGNPPPSFGGRYFTFVKLRTDNGIVGYGEAYAATFRPHVVEAQLRDVAEMHLLGHDPFHVERFWRVAYGRGFSGRPDVSLLGTISALEMACWDIIGKSVGKPVYELLGGRVRSRLRSYTYLYPEPGDVTDVYVDPQLAAERAAEEVGRGFTAVKFDPMGPYTAYDGRQPSLARIELAVEFLRAIRSTVGRRADLLVGTHGQFTSSGAIRLARQMEQFDPLWFEEPVPPDNISEMSRVAGHTTIPIAAGERLTTKNEFARLLEAQAASIVQVNVSRAGGLLEAKKIASNAEVHGAQIAPHLYNGPIGGAANIALAACSPNFLILESIGDWSGFHADLLRIPIEWRNGYVVPPDRPGLGAELDEDVAQDHPYEGDELHLTMAEDPVDGPEL